MKSVANLPGGGSKENPGALAGATGADLDKTDCAPAYRVRERWATVLRLAIKNCHPLDAAAIMTATLTDMMAGSPIPPLLSAMDEARTWAEFATPSELKAYSLATFVQMSDRDRAAFLAYVNGGGVA